VSARSEYIAILNSFLIGAGSLIPAIVALRWLAGKLRALPFSLSSLRPFIPFPIFARTTSQYGDVYWRA